MVEALETVSNELEKNLKRKEESKKNIPIKILTVLNVNYGVKEIDINDKSKARQKKQSKTKYKFTTKTIKQKINLVIDFLYIYAQMQLYLSSCETRSVSVPIAK